MSGPTICSGSRRKPARLRRSFGPRCPTCCPTIGDLLGGVELKHQLRTTIFDGTQVAEGSADIAQLVVGWNGRWSDNLGTNTLDVRFKSNPGGVLAGNNSAAWSAFTNGRVTDVQTNLITLEYGRVTPLPKGLSLKSEASVLASSKPLRTPNASGSAGSTPCAVM